MGTSAQFLGNQRWPRCLFSGKNRDGHTHVGLWMVEHLQEQEGHLGPSKHLLRRQRAHVGSHLWPSRHSCFSWNGVGCGASEPELPPLTLPLSPPCASLPADHSSLMEANLTAKVLTGVPTGRPFQATCSLLTGQSPVLELGTCSEHIHLGQGAGLTLGSGEVSSGSGSRQGRYYVRSQHPPLKYLISITLEFLLGDKLSLVLGCIPNSS